MYVGTDDGRLQLYDVAMSEIKVSTDLEIGPIQQMKLSKNGRFMIVAGKEKIHVEDLLCKLAFYNYYPVGQLLSLL